ncbi:octapeptide-repeat protein T2-like [Oscarella lobularis]|uniref:octapeptide-repeat protein T2-like n=1 Tax=Oscarella lobularis TaxID=121494 RepID=UPI00331313A8
MGFGELSWEEGKGTRTCTGKERDRRGQGKGRILGAFKWKDEERDKTRGMEDARINQEEKGAFKWKDVERDRARRVEDARIKGAFEWNDVERDKARRVEDARINQEEKGTREDFRGIQMEGCGAGQGAWSGRREDQRGIQMEGCGAGQGAWSGRREDQGAFKWKDVERDKTRGMEDARINQEEKGTREDFRGIQMEGCGAGQGAWSGRREDQKGIQMEGRGAGRARAGEDKGTVIDCI